MRHYRVLVLNAAYYPNNIVDWKDAFNLIFDNKAYVLENYNKTIKTISQEFQIPSVVVLNKHVGHKNQVKWSKVGVITRDNHICAYCGAKFPRKKLTIDHIIPKSRFKNKSEANSWLNCVASCFNCNSRKKQNRTPEEANMPLLYHPYEPKYSYEYFADWNESETDISWLPYLPKKKESMVVKFDGSSVVGEVTFGRKSIR
jgi:5-methylcytosine-specific restriction endonuclease McrA